MLIVPEKTCASQTNTSHKSFPCTLDSRLPPVTKKRLEAPRQSILSCLFLEDAMLCFNLYQRGDERQCNKAKRSFCSYQMAFHS